MIDLIFELISSITLKLLCTLDAKIDNDWQLTLRKIADELPKWIDK
jgi:hypothetical protein